VAGLAVGTGFGIDTLVKAGQVEEHCDGAGCDREGLDLNERAYTSAAVSTIAFGIGLAGIAAGVVLIVTAPSNTRKSASRLWVIPVSDDHGVGFAAGGTF
jgi:hypothetical protein